METHEITAATESVAPPITSIDTTAPKAEAGSKAASQASNGDERGIAETLQGDFTKLSIDDNKVKAAAKGDSKEVQDRHMETTKATKPAKVNQNSAKTVSGGAEKYDAARLSVNGATSPTKKKSEQQGTRIDASGKSTTHKSLVTNTEGGKEEIVDVEEEEEEEEESSEISASDEDGSWISWFCSLRGNEFFCEVDEDYIQDDFNLTGLNQIVPYYDYALDMVLDVEMPMEDSLTEAQQEIVESAAEMLYGLIHARYIVTNRGMHAMYEKYRSAAFGRCPHVFCQGQPVLPVGLSDLPRNYTVNVFCPRCHGLFFPKSTRQANIDGAYFGTTFPHLYLMTHPDMIPAKPTQHYQPRVYGFKINQSSLYYRNHEESASQRQEGRDRLNRRRSRQSGR